MYSIELADGTRINNLGLNGDNFTSVSLIEASTFENNMSPVTIYDPDGNSEIHEYMDLVQITQFNGEYWFVLRDLTQTELTNIDIQSKIDYLAMMTDVDLEEA